MKGTKGPLKGSVKGPPSSTRLRVHCGRVTGKILRWKDTEGWIRPDTAIDHPFKLKNRGEVLVKKQDVSAGQVLETGTAVDFLVYAEKDGGGRLCAEFCRPLPKAKPQPGQPGLKAKGSVGQVLLKPGFLKTKANTKIPVKPQPPAASSQNSQASEAIPKFMKPAAKAKIALPKAAVIKTHLKPAVNDAGKEGKLGKGWKEWLVGKDGKGNEKGGKEKGGKEKGGKEKGGKEKGGKEKGGKEKGAWASEWAENGRKAGAERTQLKVLQTGVISKWLGNYGWIEADKAIDHAAASKHGGKIFLHKKDLQSEEAPKPGSRVSFSLYVQSWDLFLGISKFPWSKVPSTATSFLEHALSKR